MQWIKDNLLAALIVTGLLNILIDVWNHWFTSDAEKELEQKSGFWAGVTMIIRGGGVDVMKVLTGIRQLVTSLLGAVKKSDGPLLILFGLGVLAGSSASCGTVSTGGATTVGDVTKEIADRAHLPAEAAALCSDVAYVRRAGVRCERS